MSYVENDIEARRSEVTLRDAAWLRDADAAAVMLALNGGNQDRKALFVGGCVRDAVSGRETGDIDIATVHAPPDTIKILENKNIKVLPTGLLHGTVTAVCNGKPFQITSLRRDVETFGRRAVVAFTDDWEADAARRDFTMNTLLADMHGAVFDPLGQGVADLLAGHVRFVGDPETRIAEDYLRILRYFRFHAVYGRGAPDRAALKACRKMAEHVPDLSRERITQEFMRIIAGGGAVDILELMFSNGVLRDLAHPRYAPDVMRRLIDLQTRHGMAEPFSRLIVLAAFDGGQIAAIEKRLLLPRRDQLAMAGCKDAVRRLEGLDGNAVRLLVYTYKNEIAGRSVLLWAAQNRADVPGDILRIAREWAAPVFPLSGADLKTLDVPEGPEMGRILHDVEDWWLAQDMRPDRAACLARAQALR